MEGKSKIMLKNSNSPGGGIGRHKGLKIPRSNTSCRFKSGPGYHLK